MAVYTVTISSAGSPDIVSLTDGSTYAVLEVSAGRGPKGDGFTGGSYNASTGVVTFTSNDGIGFSTGDLRGSVDLSSPSPIGDVTPNTGAFTTITVTGTVDGRDVAADGSKLDGIEAGADVTDAANVTAAGALMDSELTDIAAVKALDQGVSTTDDPTFTNAQLADIAETKGVTAVDVFVYDTSMDSDGGAWRKRTQHTSWYNETLNTSTRGSRREFPAVAVIVAESNKVTIYDGDDPSLPMWMVFEWNVRNFIGSYIGSTKLTSVQILNGVLLVGHDGDGVAIIDFLKDTSYKNASGLLIVWNRDVSGRNANSATEYLDTSDASKRIVNSTVNDVAMTVLPDAPIDPATGLPVPAIAVATAGGVSVITDSGAVYDSYATAAQGAVAWLDEGLIYADAASVYSLFWATNVDIAAGDGFGDQVATSTTLDDFPMPAAPESIVGFGSEFVLGGDFDAFGVVKKGVSRFAFNSSALGSTMSALLTSTYNTGWMNGDIKGAFLSDTDDTDLVGSGELVTNGTFDTNLTGWTLSASTPPTWNAAGAMQFNSDGATFSDADQSFSTVVGATYVLSVDMVNTAGSTLVFVGTSQGGSQVLSDSISTIGVKVYTFTATTTTTWLRLRDGSGASNQQIDNVSVKLADADRSVNNKGLIVNGTVTRTPVATGADLVAYSGFSASNYLEQPYNSDLDFGTGDFCVMGWFKSSALSDYIFDRDAGGNRIALITSSNTGFSLLTDDGTTLIIGGNNPDEINNDTWYFGTALRRSGVVEIYTNGQLKNSAANTDDVSDATNQPTLIIGANSAFGNTWAGSMALLRISATAPTAEQIKKIYEDEKVLFQENAQATLYGSSDAVTALAHDPVTDLLHVGTSAGRSVFQGLRRVDNTTDAVGTAISASNGLVVEE
jgi:hypothetical protein